MYLTTAFKLEISHIMSISILFDTDTEFYYTLVAIRLLAE